MFRRTPYIIVALLCVYILVDYTPSKWLIAPVLVLALVQLLAPRAWLDAEPRWVRTRRLHQQH